MTYTANTIPVVDPMMVRRITPVKGRAYHGGSVVLDEYEVEDIGVVDERLDFDESRVDCSNCIFYITTQMLYYKCLKSLTVFPSRRWRNFREGEIITTLPTKDCPLLYIGNPVRLLVSQYEGLVVMRMPEFLIRSGPEL